MRAGTRRLLALTTPSPARAVLERLDGIAQLSLSTAPHGGIAAVLEDAIAATLDALVAQAGGPAWDEASFARLRDHVAGHLAELATRVGGQVVAILDARRELLRRLDAITAAPLQDARRDVARQLGRLVYPGFVSATGVRRLADVERYLRGAAAAPGAAGRRARRRPRPHARRARARGGLRARA